MSDLVERVKVAMAIQSSENNAARSAIATVLRDMWKPSDAMIHRRSLISDKDFPGETYRAQWQGMIETYASEKGIPLSQGETE